MPLVPTYVAELEPYRPGGSAADVRHLSGLQSAVRLSSNENPFGASPLALRAIASSLNSVGRYPSGGAELRRVLALHFGVRPENVIAGSGSEGIISNIIRTFLCDDDEVLTAAVTFIGFRVLARSRGVAYRTVPLRDWRLDLKSLAAAVTDRTKIIYLANPNNPTGTIFTRAEFEAFRASVPERVLIVLDEAYFEYAHHDPDYPDSMHYRYDNVITLRTFSKAYGLAGARIGYGLAHEELIANLIKIKLPFEPSVLAEAAGIAALGDHAHLSMTLRENARGLTLVTRELRSMGITVIPSHANFVMTLWPSAASAANVADQLLRSGIIVRPLDTFGVPNGIRITIGTPAENELLIGALRTQEQSKCA